MEQKRITRTEDEWIELIQQYQGSGMTIKAWCGEQGIPMATFYNRMRRIRSRQDKTARQALQPEATEEQHIVPLSIIDSDTCGEGPVPASGNGPAVSLTIGRWHAVVHNHADRETVRYALQALQQLC